MKREVRHGIGHYEGGAIERHFSTAGRPYDRFGLRALELRWRKAIKKFFTPELRSFIKDNDKYHIESTNNVILIFRYFRIMSISEIKELNSFGEQLSAHFHNCVEMPKEAP